MPRNRFQGSIKIDFEIGNRVLNTILFAHDQAIFSESESDFQIANNRIENIVNGFNMRISTTEIKTMAFQKKNHIRCKITIDNKTME
jgi:hypothetical protein